MEWYYVCWPWLTSKCVICFLYLIYDEAMIREATDDMETGISVGGRINTIRFADDKAVVANTVRKG